MLQDIQPVKYLGASSLGKLSELENAPSCVLMTRANEPGAPGGALGYFLGGYVPPGIPNWHPVLEKNSPKIDTPF